MENKYFTPDIEDFYIGYEYEQGLVDSDWFTTGWEKRIIDEQSNLKLIKEYPSLHRVPYLTKEQIEAEGWEYKHTHKDLIYYDERIFFEKRKSNKKEDIWTLQLEYYKNNLVRIQIDQGHDWKRFLGECKDINTFRKIIKLLKIN